VQQYQNVIQDKFGNVIVGASVAVYVYGTTTPATIYSGNGSGVLPSNTVTTNSLGEFAFYAANGRYSLSVSATNFVAENFTDFILYDPADIGAVTASGVAFTPFSTISATNVQNAIQEVVADLAGASGSSTVGFLQSGTGAVTRTVQAKERDVVSVKDFGAVGDGVADDTAAIVAANAAATGRILLFPAGTYKFTGSITPGSTTSGQNAIWAGEGWQTKLQAADSTSKILITNSCSIRDMILYGSVTTAGSYVGTGIQIGNTTFVGFVELENLRVRYFQVGIRMAAALWTSVKKCAIEFHQIGVDFNAGGASLTSTTVAFKECNIANCDRNGVAASYTPNPNLSISFQDGSIQNNSISSPATYPQFACGSVYGLNLDGVYFENTNAAVNLDLASANGAVVKNCYFQGGTIGVKATTAPLKNALITGNYFSALTGSYSVEASSAVNLNVFGNQWSLSPVSTTNSLSGTNVTDGDTYRFGMRFKTEGTFSPTIQGTSVAGSNTYTTQTGYYNQIGNIVYFRGRLSMSVKDAAMAGNVQINLVGLPNSANANQAYNMCQVSPNSGITFSGTYAGLYGEISSGVTNLIDIQQMGPSGTLQLPVTGIAAGATVRFSGFYVVSG